MFIAWEYPFDLLGFLLARQDTQELFIQESCWSDPHSYEMLSRPLWRIALASMENVPLDRICPSHNHCHRVITITEYGHPLLCAGYTEGQVMAEIEQMEQQEMNQWENARIKDIWPLPDFLRRELDEIERELLELE